MSIQPFELYHKIPGCYLIHFSPAYKHAAHYLGFSWDIGRRINEHMTGNGARLTQVAVEAGCQILVVRVWKYQFRPFEKQLKKRKNSPKLCPLCNCKHIPDPLVPGIENDINFYEKGQPQWSTLYAV